MPFKSILGTFVELEEKPKEESKQDPVEEAPVTSASPDVPAAPPASVPQAPRQQTSYGTIDPKMLELLDSAIADANQPGFDYFEFAEALGNLSSLPEAQRFQAVFTTAKSMGITQQSLIESVEHYQQVIAKEQESFLQHVESKRVQEVVSRQEQKAANEEAIATSQTQIAELQKKIAELQQKNIELDTEISQETLQINNTSSAFEATYNTVAKRLEDDKAKIQTHLSEGA